METDMKYPYVPPTAEVVDVRIETYILILSSYRGGYGDEFEIW